MDSQAAGGTKNELSLAIAPRRESEPTRLCPAGRDFTIPILALIAVAALPTANDEHRSSRAMRESGAAALYAAEAGAGWILRTQVAGTKTVLDTIYASMAPGASVDPGVSARRV